MLSNRHHNPNRKVHYKDREFTAEYIRKEIEKGLDISFINFLSEYPEIYRYYWALHFVSTTNKAACEAASIPVENGTRYKKTWEGKGKLTASIDEFTCPYTGHSARFLSINPKDFDKLRRSNSNQLNLFDDEI